MARFGFASSAALFAVFAVVPSVARASCKVDSDCPKGWTCDEATSEICSGSSCPDNDPTCSSEEVCETVSEYECVPGTCSADADCADGMTCYEYVDESCEDYRQNCTSAGSDCEPRPECDTSTQSACLPQWIPPCTEDADCGAGFTCVAQQMCECSTTSRPIDATAGAGSDVASGGASDGPSDSDTDCTCTTADEKRCEPVEEKQTCDADSECPSGWTCEELTTTEDSCTASEPAPSAAGAAGAPESDAYAPECTTTTSTEKLCMPQYFDLVGVSASGAGDSAALGGDDDDDDASVPVDRGETKGDDDDDTNGAAGHEETLGTDKSSSDDGCGCRVGPGRGAPSGLWLGVLGLVGLGLRRRRGL